MSKKVLAAIEAAGGEFEDWGGRTELRGCAALPAGTVWEATGAHTIAVHYYSDRPAGWRTLLQDVQQGTRPCDLQQCDICEDESEGQQ